MQKIKVYYNSACPVCKAGIASQQCRMAARADDIPEIEWLDVHTRPELAAELGIGLEIVRERLHVVRADGTLRVGTDAFATLFEQTRGQRWLARLLSLTWLRPWAQRAYNALALRLYQWNRNRGHW